MDGLALGEQVRVRLASRLSRGKPLEGGRVARGRVADLHLDALLGRCGQRHLHLGAHEAGVSDGELERLARLILRAMDLQVPRIKDLVYRSKEMTSMFLQLLYHPCT